MPNGDGLIAVLLKLQEALLHAQIAVAADSVKARFIASNARTMFVERRSIR